MNNQEEKFVPVIVGPSTTGRANPMPTFIRRKRKRKAAPAAPVQEPVAVKKNKLVLPTTIQHSPSSVSKGSVDLDAFEQELLEMATSPEPRDSPQIQIPAAPVAPVAPVVPVNDYVARKQMESAVIKMRTSICASLQTNLQGMFAKIQQSIASNQDSNKRVQSALQLQINQLKEQLHRQTEISEKLQQDLSDLNDPHLITELTRSPPIPHRDNGPLDLNYPDFGLESGGKLDLGDPHEFLFG
jgi:hypothetical protein